MGHLMDTFDISQHNQMYQDLVKIGNKKGVDHNRNSGSKYKSMLSSHKVCIVTVGRIKIGYEMVLMLLSTNYAIQRDWNSSEKGFNKFNNQLIVYGLYLCSLNQFDQFNNYISNNCKQICR